MALFQQSLAIAREIKNQDLEARSLLSFILFGGKSRDGKNYATLRDIATWKLDTDLVVLSACETGLADDQFDTKAISFHLP